MPITSTKSPIYKIYIYTTPYSLIMLIIDIITSYYLSLKTNIKLVLSNK
jgi:hypothetical protein